jgi:hypothetical protein
VLLTTYSAATVTALVADISAANTAGGSNTITLTASTTSPYVLTAVNNTTNGATGLPVIAALDNLTIVGNGDTIERSTATGTPDFRLLEVASGGSLTLEHLTAQGGLALCVWHFKYNLPPLDGGGAIFSQGTLVLSGVTVQDNMAEGGTYDHFYGIVAGGGGIFSTGGSVTLEGRTIIQSNEAKGGEAVSGEPGGNAFGGGLYASGGTVTVTNSTLESNTALGGLEPVDRLGIPVETVGAAGGTGIGGGLYASGGTISMTNATLENNIAASSALHFGDGGGLYLAAGTTATLDAATVAQVTGNTASSGAAYDNIDGTYKLS